VTRAAVCARVRAHGLAPRSACSSACGDRPCTIVLLLLLLLLLLGARCVAGRRVNASSWAGATDPWCCVDIPHTLGCADGVCTW
jgi:hypothetical protein